MSPLDLLVINGWCATPHKTRLAALKEAVLMVGGITLTFALAMASTVIAAHLFN